MKSDQKNNRYMATITALAFLVVPVCILSIYLWHIHAAKNVLPAGWKQYINRQYGIGFNYPAVWGSPQMTVSQFPQGKEYTVNISTFPSDSIDISLTLDTNDLVHRVCTGTGCQTIPSVTKQYVQSIKGRFSDKYSDTYSVLNSLQGRNTLTVYMIKDLSTLNVSAIDAAYTVKLGDNNKCPRPDSPNNCIESSTYDTFVKMLNSVHTI